MSLLLLYGKGIGDGVQQCLDASNLSFCLPLHVFMRSDKIEACRSCKGPMVGLKIEKPGTEMLKRSLIARDSIWYQEFHGKISVEQTLQIIYVRHGALAKVRQDVT